MITPLYCAVFGFMLISLSIHVVRGRRLFSVAMGDLDELEMRRRIRAQANFTEYTPFFLILLACAEYNHLAAWCLHSIALVFVAGRIMHAYSLLKNEQYRDGKLISKPVWRFRGMVCTFSTLLLLSLIVLLQSVY